jgi:hypothetical protein
MMWLPAVLAAAAAASAAPWKIYQNVDALPSTSGRGITKMGQKGSSDACAQTCSTTTTVWVWSSASHNCYCTQLGTFDHAQRKGIVSGCKEDGPDCVVGCGTCARQPPPPPPPLPPLPFTPTQEPNMNGVYQLSETQHSNTSKYPQQYRDSPGGAEYFDVYSPLISQLYSQVYWKALPPVQLPAHVRSKFDGRTMAIIGFEVDQVQNPTVPAAGGSAQPGSPDLSVPINVVTALHPWSCMHMPPLLMHTYALCELLCV